MTRRSWFYAALIVIWAAIVAWQVGEHIRVRRSARAALINRTKDISNTLGLVLRSQRRFGGVISKERLESVLNELVKPGELNAIALLNAGGEVVASAGTPVDFHKHGVLRSSERWDAQTVTLMNLIDLGTNLTQDLERANRTIVVPRRELFGQAETNRPPFDGTNFMTGSSNSVGSPRFPWRPPPEGGRPRGTNEPGPGFRRPFWMNEGEYQSVIQKKGVHSFVLVMSTAPLRAAYQQDLWLRAVIGFLATVSAAGSGLAWRNLGKSSELQLRLVRASELNSHLKEMNLAAAGLAHETRNPLNIIRGLAQMISMQETSSEIRKKSRDIIDETDRVTAQLNEFINYSRPREVRRSSVALLSVAAEVVRTLGHDLEEKRIRLETSGDDLRIEADEQLLRQALFNLLLNAIQAVEANGQIQIAATRRNASGAILDIRDNGPGVLPAHRTEIFKPYFTTHQKGTGLGLTVVQQIVLAHGWEIECLPNEPRGAIFRISHLKAASAA